MKSVRVSAAMLRQEFHPCEPGYIKTVCHAKCCDAPTRPSGMLVSIHESEQWRIERNGGIVAGGLLQPADGERGCQFKDRGTCLCKLHGTDDKPFGCIASPFTLNKSDTLIVRNRYRMLPCYKAAGAQPAYITHRKSLDEIFGRAEAERICRELTAPAPPLAIDAEMPDRIYRMLKDNDATKNGCDDERARTVRP